MIDWRPTMQLRWVNKKDARDGSISIQTNIEWKTQTFQQLWEEYEKEHWAGAISHINNLTGKTEWRDVPVVEEDK